MIFIPGNVPSSKRGKIITKHGLIHSEAVQNYLKLIGVKEFYSGGKKKGVSDYQRRPNLFRLSVGDFFDNIEYPVMIGFHFVRKTKNLFDFSNLTHIIADLLVAHGFLEGDDINKFLPVPINFEGKWWTVDKERPGVWLVKRDARKMERMI